MGNQVTLWAVSKAHRFSTRLKTVNSSGGGISLVGLLPTQGNTSFSNRSINFFAWLSVQPGLCFVCHSRATCSKPSILSFFLVAFLNSLGSTPLISRVLALSLFLLASFKGMAG